MKQKLIFIFVTILAFQDAAVAGLDESAVQGIYEGNANGAHIEARVIAEGDGKFALLLRRETERGNFDCSKLDGITENAGVRFSGKAAGSDWIGTSITGSVALHSKNGDSYMLARIQRKPPTLAKQPPPGAIVYLDGKSLANLKHTQGGKMPATDTAYEADGSYKIPEHGVDTETYGPDFEYDMHLEFKIPLASSARGWSRGNGNWLFLPNNSKITLLDSFGEPGSFAFLPEREREKLLKTNPSAAATFKGIVCGGIYGVRNPDNMERIDTPKGDSDDNLYPLAALPPLEWQTLDLEYRLHHGGNPRLTAFLNGVKIHDQVDLQMPARKGVFHFRPSAVLWRNFWALPLTAQKQKATDDAGPNKPAEVIKQNSPDRKATDGLVITHDLEIAKVNGVPILLETAVKITSSDGKPRPAVLMIHGGGWKSGSARGSMGLILPNPALYYAQNGYFVASVGYRLSGQAKWPAQIQDCKLAVRYLRAKAKQLNIDPEHIGCCGFSAGGHLAGCLGTMVDAPDMEGEGGYSNVSSRVQAVVMLSGPVDMTFYFDKRGSGRKAEELKNELFGVEWKEHPEILKKASSNAYVKPGLPPFWIGTSDKDQAVPTEQADILAGALREAGVPVEYLMMKNGGHGLSAIKDRESKGIGEPSPSPEQALQMTLRFLGKYLR